MVLRAMHMHRGWFLLGFVGTQLASGCQDEPALREPGPASPPAGAPVSARQAIVHEVRWPAASRVDRALREKLSDAARAAVDRASVPVWVPSEPSWLPGAIVISREHWTSVAISADGITMALRATRLAHRYGGIAPAQGRKRVRGEPAFASRHERIPSVAWLEDGVAYSVDVECAEPSDARCADDAYVLELADSLAYVGGRGSGVVDGGRRPEGAR